MKALLILMCGALSSCSLTWGPEGDWRAEFHPVPALDAYDRVAGDAVEVVREK